MATSSDPKFETIDISEVSEYSGVLFSANNILILFGVPFALTSIGQLGSPEGSDWWSVFAILAGVCAPLLWLVSGYNRTYWLLWMWFSLVLVAGASLKIISYLFNGDLLGFAGGIFIGAIPLIFLFMAFAGCLILLGNRIEVFDAKATDVLGKTGQLFHQERKVGVGGLSQVGRLIYLAGLVGAFSFPVALLISSLSELGVMTGWGVPDFLVLAVFAFPIFGLMIFFGRRLMQPAAYTKLTDAEELPVLLLRAFADDERRVERKTDLTNILFFGYQKKIRLEEAIAEELWQIGPFYGVGQPGEILPKLGASKAYFSDEQWQGEVMSWMRSAQLIVMIAGQSEWLKWEFDRVIELGAIGKLMILFPPDEEDAIGKHWKMVTRWLAHTPYARALKSGKPEKVRALYFKQKDQVRAIVSNTDDQTDFELAIRLAAYDILKP
jgi:hypothetical protein